MIDQPEQFLKNLFSIAVKAADPAVIIPPYLPTRPKGRTLVLGAGKASAAMARALEDHWGDDENLSGLVITRYDHAVDCQHIEIIEAAHPVPDLAGQQAAKRMLDLAKDLGPDDLAICLISGGGSSLTAVPVDGVSLADKQDVNKALLRSGATISEMNKVRKHLSLFKGGRLAKAVYPARLVTILISDVPGDDADVIASGPTVPDTSTCADVREIIARYQLDLPENVKIYFESMEETPKADDPAFTHGEVIIAGAPIISLEAAAKVATAHDITPIILGDALEGEAREIAIMHGGIAKSILVHGQPIPRPAVILSGGETTVTIKNKQGRGGRNSEFLLALAINLAGQNNIYAIACDTDGIDGSEDNAGAIITPDSLIRAAQKGLNSRKMLDQNLSYKFFESLDDLIMTGPTLTNVNDFRAVLVL